MRENILIIAATALVFAACSDVDYLKKDIQTGNNEAISFTSYSQPATRAENSGATDKWVFFNHHTTFQVWGYKNTETTAVFSGDIVTVAEDAQAATGYSYTYEPTRYWDKAASTYQFYAAAPSNSSWTFNGVSSVANQNAGYFTTTSTLTGVNLKATTPATTMSDSFKDKDDVDKLIAEPCEVKKAKFAIEPVQLNFIHILSKLNVTIKKDPDKLASQTVILKSFEVMNLYNKGDFNENTSVANLASGSNARWTKTNDATAVKYESKKDWEITTTPNYIIESLVIPQNALVETVALDGKEHAAVLYEDYLEYNAAKDPDLADAAAFNELSDADKTKEEAIAAVGDNSKPYFKIVYTIQDGNNTPEQFTAYYNLATAFKGTAAQPSTLGFFEGFQNTLNITISPAEIEFCADIYHWDDNEKNLTIY